MITTRSSAGPVSSEVASRLRYFWRFLFRAKRRWVPSQVNHTALTCGSPFGPIVAIYASAVECRRSRECSSSAIVHPIQIIKIDEGTASEVGATPHDDAHNAFMTLPFYTRTREGEAPQLGMVRNLPTGPLREEMPSQKLYKMRR